MPRQAAPKLYPVKPLFEAARRYGQACPLTVIVEVCRLSGSELAQARLFGLTESQADRCAIRLGRHPHELWGWDWWDGVEARDRAGLIFAGLRREVG